MFDGASLPLLQAKEKPPFCVPRALRGRAVSRARVILLNAALGPLDYRVPRGMEVAPGSIVVAPLGPRQLIGVVWEEDRFPDVETVGDNRLRPLVGLVDAPPLPAPLRRLIEWTADYYMAPLGAVLRMALSSSSALEGAQSVVEYRATGVVPERLAPQRAQALDAIGERQGMVRELAEAAGWTVAGFETSPDPSVALALLEA